jgi:phage host-nuclease inhibitor protein Gam
MFGSYNAGTFKVSLRKTESVSITDEQALEDRFLRTKLEPNKVAIKDALNAGEQVTGAVITINQNLNIR